MLKPYVIFAHSKNKQYFAGRYETEAQATAAKLELEKKNKQHDIKFVIINQGNR